METERLTLPDGGWWEIKTVITRGMRKQLNQASLKALGSNASGLMAGDGVKAQLLEHPETLDINAVDDAMLLLGSVAYSYGPTVELATIDTLPDETIQTVLKRLQELFGGLSQREHADFFGRR